MAYPTYSAGAGARASWSLLAYLFLVFIAAMTIFLIGTYVLHMDPSDFSKPMNTLVEFVLVFGLAAILYLGLDELVKHARAKPKQRITL